MRRPGKKLVTMAVAGKALQCSWGIGVWVVAGFEVVVLGTLAAMFETLAEVVEALVDAEDAADVVEVELFCSSIMHRLF